MSHKGQGFCCNFDSIFERRTCINNINIWNIQDLTWKPSIMFLEV